jgi:hypothetical protein
MLIITEGSGTSNVPPQLIKKALPYLEDRAMYPEDYVTFRIEGAFCAVREAKRAKIFTTKEIRASLKRAIRALRIIELEKNKAAGQILPLRDLCTEELLESVGELSNIFFGRRSKKGGKRNPGRREAVNQGYKLLRDFGNQPTRTRGGAWHELAGLLYVDANVDLFQTILDFQPPTVIQAPGPNLHEIVRQRAEAWHTIANILYEETGR